MKWRSSLLMLSLWLVLGVHFQTTVSGVPQWTSPVPLVEVNRDGVEEWSPFLSFDGLTLYFTRVRSPEFYEGRMFQATRTVPWGPFTAVGEVPGPLNSAAGHVMCPQVSPDNLRMYYNDQVGSVFSLKRSERTDADGPWPQGVPIAELNALGRWLTMPRLTADELILVFRGGEDMAGQGGSDLWIAERSDRHLPFGNVRNLSTVNSRYDDNSPFISPDGLQLLFASNRAGSMQLYMAERTCPDEPFGCPRHMSVFDTPGGWSAQPCLSADGSTLYFQHQEGEDRTTRDIYVSHAAAPDRPMWRSPEPLCEVNTAVHDKAPFLSYDGLTLYFCRDDAPGGHARIFQAKRTDLFEPFGPGQELTALTQPGTHVAHPWVSPDELRLYYYIVSGSRRRLRVAERPSKGAQWSPGAYISELNALGDVANPSLTADELVIVFDALGFAGSKGDRDLWMATRSALGRPFANVTNLSSLNTAGPDGHAALSPDGLTLYYSSSPKGTPQIFRATRPSRRAAFGPPEHLSIFDVPNGHAAYPCISADGQTFYYGLWLDGSYMDIYVSHTVSAHYVDAVKGSDRNDGGSPERAFATIQKAIDCTTDGDVVNVRPDFYREQLCFRGQAITVQGAGDAAILEAPGRFAASFYMGEGPDTVLRNFVITNSHVGVAVTDCSPTLENITVVSNDWGIEAYRDAHPHIVNCILWGNLESDLFGCTATYSCIQREVPGEGNFSDDPLFADPMNGDYHLRSQCGRYWPEHDIWVLDDVTSPCIDAGEPSADFSHERSPNGGRINIGAYGGTPSASCSARLLPGQARYPYPSDGDSYSGCVLSWMAGENATSHDVYFGTTWQLQFMGNQTACEFEPKFLHVGTTYLWRVDERNDTGVTTGEIWSFTVSH